MIHCRPLFGPKPLNDKPIDTHSFARSFIIDRLTSSAVSYERLLRGLMDLPNKPAIINLK